MIKQMKEVLGMNLSYFKKYMDVDNKSDFLTGGSCYFDYDCIFPDNNIHIFMSENNYKN